MQFPPKPFDSAKRMAIMLLLERHGAIIFSDLFRATHVSRGALDSHLKTLEKYAYIYRELRFINTNSRIVIVPTPEGLLALRNAKRIWYELLSSNDTTAEDK